MLWAQQKKCCPDCNHDQFFVCDGCGSLREDEAARRVPIPAPEAPMSGYHLVQCFGEAHENPYIDNCGECAPRWGWIEVPLEFATADAWRHARAEEPDLSDSDDPIAWAARLPQPLAGRLEVLLTDWNQRREEICEDAGHDPATAAECLFWADKLLVDVFAAVDAAIKAPPPRNGGHEVFGWAMGADGKEAGRVRTAHEVQGRWRIEVFMIIHESGARRFQSIVRGPSAEPFTFSSFGHASSAEALLRAREVRDAKRAALALGVRS